MESLLTESPIFSNLLQKEEILQVREADPQKLVILVNERYYEQEEFSEIIKSGENQSRQLRKEK